MNVSSATFWFLPYPARFHANESASTDRQTRRSCVAADVLRRDKHERLGEKHFVRILASGIFRVEKADGKDLLLRAEGQEFRAWG